MSPPARFDEIDLAAEAGRLADLFAGLSQALDEFRLDDHDPPLTAEERRIIKERAQALESLAHYFTSASIGAILQSFQPNLANIKQITVDAKDQVALLEDVAKVISIASSAVSLGTAIASGDPAAIVAAAGGLVQSIG